MSEQDNKNELNHPLTKGEFQEHLETLVKVVATKEDLRELGDELNDNISNFKNEILTSNDKVVKKLDVVINELPVIHQTLREHSDRIETLENKTRHIQARLGI